MSNLRVRVENQTGIFEAGIFLSGPGVVANGVTVLGEPGVDNAVGVIVRTGAILRNSLVQVPPTGNANEAIGAEGGARIENVSAAGDKMIDARNPGPAVVVRRLRSPTPSHTGNIALGSGSVDVSDALIRLTGGSTSVGLSAEATSGSTASIVARHVTVVGTGDALNAGRGAYASGFNAASTRPSTYEIRSSTLSAPTSRSRRSREPSRASRSATPTTTPRRCSTSSGGDAAAVAGPGNLLANPSFVDGAAADFRLRDDSPLIDRGFPGAGSISDLDGLPRPNDGNGDGVAVRDLGAFEYQGRASRPTVVPDTSAPLFRILSKRLRLNRRGRVAVVLRGPSNETAASGGSVGLRRKGRRLGRKRLSLLPSSRAVVRVKLSRRSARRVRRAQRVRVMLVVAARDSAGNARTVRKRVTLRA